MDAVQLEKVRQAQAARAYRNIRMVCIQNYFSSGTLFLHSLLDNHPDVLSLPGLAPILYFKNVEKIKNDESNNPVTRFMADNPSLFDVEDKACIDYCLDRLGDDRTQNACVRPEDFIRHFAGIASQLGHLDRRSFLYTAYAAFALCLGREVPKAPVLVFPIHSRPLEEAQALLADFPDAKFAYMVRHPVSCFVSGVRHLRANGFDAYVAPAEAVAAQLFLNITRHGGEHAPYGDRPYTRESAANCQAIPLEALHERPKETLVDLCAFLDLPWHDNLMRSTFNGLTWWNRAESPQISGFDAGIPARGVDQATTAAERLRLAIVARPQFRAWGYPARLPGWPDWAVGVIFTLLLALPGKTDGWPNPLRIWTLAKTESTWLPAALRERIDRRARAYGTIASSRLLQGDAYRLRALLAGGGRAICVLHPHPEGGFNGAPVRVEMSTVARHAPKIAYLSAEDIFDPLRGWDRIRVAAVHLWSGLKVWLRDYARFRRTLIDSYRATRRDEGTYVRARGC